MIRTLFILMLVALLSSFARASDGSELITRVELRSTVRLNTEALTLGQLARIEGPQHDALAKLKIYVDDAIRKDAWSIIDMTEIRTQIKQAPTINDGSVTVVGPDVRVIRVATRDEQPAKSKPEPTQAKPTHATLQQQIERWTLARLGVTKDKARLRFNDRDADALRTSIEGRIVEIREIGRSERMAIGVVVYENERIVLDRTMQFEALIERPVRVATSQIRRSNMISNENSKIEYRWLSATEAIADPKTAVGLITTSTIDPGRMVMTAQLEAPILVERGQIVNARSIAGSVSVSLLVRAKDNGRLGDVISLESRDRSQQFQARVAGAGRVVIIHEPIETTLNASKAGS